MGQVKVDFMNIHKSGTGRENIQTKKSQRFFQDPGGSAGIQGRKDLG